MTDLIDRQAAIDAVRENCKNVLEGCNCDLFTAATYKVAHMHIEELLSLLPSVEKHGKWVHDNPLTDTLVCTECNYNIPTEELKTPCCPWCGARMDKGEPDDH